MELTQQQREQLMEMERCFHQYFRMQIKPVMQSVQAELSRKQIHEEAEFMNTPAGIVAMAHPYGLGPMQVDMVVHMTGEWNSKTTEDYLAMCQERLESSPYLSNDLSILADSWREKVINVIGKERYDEKSAALGQDLALAYVSYRMDDEMLQYLIDSKTPKSTMEYLMRKCADESLLGLVYNLRRSPADNLIAEEAEKAYSPSIIEKGTGKALGFGMDVLSTGGASSWASVGKLAATEVVFGACVSLYEKTQDDQQQLTVEEQISHGVFQSEDNLLGDLRNASKKVVLDTRPSAQALNSQLDGRMGLLSEEAAANLFVTPDYSLGYRLQSSDLDEKIHVPFAPDYDPDKLDKSQMQELTMALEQNTPNSSPLTETEPEQKMVVIEEETAPPVQQSTDGWENLASSFGLDGLEEVGNNLGYVVSKLPDLLVGLFTGKTKSLDLKDNMLPIASILAGMFIKNPILKMLLIGMGGLNLFNKAGKEAIVERTGQTVAVQQQNTPQFKQYGNEPLNPRMKDPEIKGNALFATVDGVPCTVQLPAHTLAAYKAGALPLNALANAVLAKSDELASIARDNYEQTDNRELARSRGV